MCRCHEFAVNATIRVQRARSSLDIYRSTLQGSSPGLCKTPCLLNRLNLSHLAIRPLIYTLSLQRRRLLTSKPFLDFSPAGAAVMLWSAAACSVGHYKGLLLTLYGKNGILKMYLSDALTVRKLSITIMILVALHRDLQTC